MHSAVRDSLLGLERTRVQSLVLTPLWLWFGLSFPYQSSIACMLLKCIPRASIPSAEGTSKPPPVPNNFAGPEVNHLSLPLMCCQLPHLFCCRLVPNAGKGDRRASDVAPVCSRARQSLAWDKAIQRREQGSIGVLTRVMK